MNEQFIKRLKSFSWRTGMMIVAYGVGVAAQNLNILELSPSVVAILGLVLGELSKALNQKT